MTGTTSEYGGAVQFSNDSTVTLISNSSYQDPSTSTVLTGSGIDALESGFVVGEYIQVQGTLSVDGSYVNLAYSDSAIVGSLTHGSLNFNTYNGQEVIVTAYVLYISGTSTRYLNLLVTDIDEATSNTVFDLTILTMNDLHGYMEQNDDGMDGLSNTAYIVEQIRNQNTFDDVLLIANGDMFQGTAISNMTHGLVVIEAMNMMGVDVMGIGNHEFDWELSTILNYFDGDPNNGEADFPLLNANIFLEVDGSFLIISGGNMFQYTIIEKEGVEVGIISYVGDIYYSIAYTKTIDYYFDLDIASSVELIATTLKNDGVDIIIVNIHDGNREDITEFYFNQQLATLTDNNGNYLVDVVINGHAHAEQADMIIRNGGSPLILIQAGANNRSLGQIVLSIDTSTMTIINQTVGWIDVTSAGTNYIADIENYIDDVSATLNDPILAVAGETITDKSMLQTWFGNVMLQTTSTDIAISNEGGIRSSGNIIAGENVNLSQLYQIAPFDNTLFIMELTYDEIQIIISNTSLFYVVKDGVSLQEGQTYKVSILDYVYYWTQWETMRSNEDIDTGIYIRDILIEDIATKGDLGELFSPITDPSADIEIKVVFYE